MSSEDIQRDISNTRQLLNQAVEQLEQLSRSGQNVQAPGSSSGSSSTSTSAPGPLTSTPYPYKFERLNIFRGNTRRYMQDSGYRSSQSKKQKRVPMWQHEFVCLSMTDSCNTPSPLERAELKRADLGSKNISIRLDGNVQDFHEDLLKAFPKLANAGGYELLRTRERGHCKELAVIEPCPGGYTAEFLKSVVGQAKVFVRPLQQDLSFETHTSDKTEVHITSSIYAMSKSY